MPPPLDADSSEAYGFSASKWGGLYGRAEHELQPKEWTTQRPKSEYVEWLGEQHDEPVRAANVAVVPPGLEAITTKGVALDGCIECGDCFTGCNHNAKRTLSTNYLADAYCNGADIFTGVTVRGVTHERADSATWSVSCVLTDEKKCGPKNHGRAGIIEEEFEIRARYVVIAAGTYGSTELLMRSQERRRGLTLSSQLGHGFSANGDFFAARYNGHRPANNAPKETTPANERKVGPTITRLLDMRARPGASALAIEEISVPAALRRVFEEIVSTGNAIHRWTRWDFSSFKPSDRDPLALDEGAIDRSMLYASMGRDSAGGRLVKLPGDRKSVV